MQRSWRILLTSVGLALTVLCSFGAGVLAAPLIGRLAGGAVTAPSGIAGQFAVFWQVWNIVTDNYVDRSKINAQQMTYGACSAVKRTEI